MKVYHLDYETRCRVDIKAAGGARYAEDCEPILYAIADGEGPVLVWQHADYAWGDLLVESDAAERLFLQAAEEARAGKALIYAHNVDFESYVTRYAMSEEYQIPLEAWRCTAAMCRKAASPVSLKDASAFWLPAEENKDAAGPALIRRFCIPDKDGNFILPPKAPKDAKGRKLRAEWEAFVAYCRQDVEAERALHRKLAPFELGGIDLEVFQATLRMNHRGLPVNRAAVDNALPFVDAFVAEGQKRFAAITGGIRPTQRDQFHLWLRAQGCPFDDLQRETIADVLEMRDFPEHVRDALMLYSGASFAAVAKLYTMRDMTMRDGRARGQFLYHGAGTGRWSATGIQPQNMRKPTVDGPDFAFSLVRDGHVEALGDFYSKPMEALASCIRNFIGDGRPMVSCDYAAIEARVVCWLAGQQDALDDFRNGSDRYCRMAAKIYATSYEAILAMGGKSKQRQLGKVVVLGCGYGMGGPKFATTCKQWGLPLLELLGDRVSDPDFQFRLAERNDWARKAKKPEYTPEDMLGADIVASFRELHGEVAKLWNLCDTAVRDAIKSPGHWFTAGPFLAYRVAALSGEQYLQCRLPSGRLVNYLRPRIVDDPDRKSGQVVYWGAHPTRRMWCNLKLYGGLLVENATQAVAADLMARGLIKAEAIGAPPFALIHDEAVVSMPEDADMTPVKHGKKTLPKWALDIQHALVTLPSWAAGLPLEAEAEVIPYYRK